MLSSRSPRWALITGASPGSLGEAEATAFLQRGINVIATSPETTTIQHVAPSPDTTEGFLIRLPLDPTNPTSLTHTLDHIRDLTSSRLDFLLHHHHPPGPAVAAPLLTTPLPRARRHFAAAVWGPLAVTQACFPLLRPARGVVVHELGVAGLRGWPRRACSGVDASAQAALWTLCDTLRVEFAPFGVRAVGLVTEVEGRVASGGWVERAVGWRGRRDRWVVAEETVAVLVGEDVPVYVWRGVGVGWFQLLLRLVLVWVVDAFLRGREGGRELEVRLRMLEEEEEEEEEGRGRKGE